MPVLGLGTSKAKDDNLFKAVCTAIDYGYRHIDCAYVYGNESIIGDAIQAKISDGTVQREELFITSKLWRSFNRPEHMEECFAESLRRLKVDYFDLYLFHWPEANKYEGLCKPTINGAEWDEDIDYVDTWKAMQNFAKSGRAKTLGVSNFNAFQMSRLLKESTDVPAVNQVESHPYFNQDKLIKFCQGHNIVITAYCPIGSFDRPTAQAAGPMVLSDPVLAQIAETHGKTAAQVALRFNLQRGVTVIPKSVTPSRLEENMRVFDFDLSPENMSAIFGLDRGQRLCPSVNDKGHKYFPFVENYSE